jgi:hypothetical protein
VIKAPVIDNAAVEGGATRYEGDPPRQRHDPEAGLSAHSANEPCLGKQENGPQSSGSISCSWALENTGPSTQTYLPPMLHRPQIPIPHFMRLSRVVMI